MITMDSRMLIRVSAILLLCLGVIVHDDVREEPQVYITIVQLSQQLHTDPEEDCESNRSDKQE